MPLGHGRLRVQGASNTAGPSLVRAATRAVAAATTQTARLEVLAFEQGLDFKQRQAFGLGHVLLHEVERIRRKNKEEAECRGVLVALTKNRAHA